jgi:DNA polymerase III epsilon subunit-like protein
MAKHKLIEQFKTLKTWIRSNTIDHWKPITTKTNLDYYKKPTIEDIEKILLRLVEGKIDVFHN